MTPAQRTELVSRLAVELGLARVGVAAAGPIRRAAYLQQWLAEGRAGEMTWLARHHQLRIDPRRLLPGARSIIVVADLYHQPEPPPADPARSAASSADPTRTATVSAKPTRTAAACCREATAGSPAGRVAQYAQGRDYHKVLRKKLHRLADRLHEMADQIAAEPFETRVCVDTAPILEREWAEAAGIGWIGKNTMILHHELGSFFFLGEIITTMELAPTGPVADHCGNCTRCLDACPTGALTAPYQMDARKCISYLTIEHRADIDPSLQPQMGDWLYGCDICQDVCPYNRKAPHATEPAYRPAELQPDIPLNVIPNWTQEDYDRYLAGSAMKRASLAMLKRNAKIALANSG